MEVSGSMAWGIVGAIALQTLAIIFALIRWSFGRNLDSSDKTVAELKRKQEEHGNSIAELRTAVTELKGDLKQLLSALPEMKGTLQTMAKAFDETREKQAAFYRAELEKLAQLLRQDMTRVVTPDLPMRLEKLEDRVRLLEDPKKRRR